MEVCSRLQRHYQQRAYRYRDLSAMLRKQAELFDKMAGTDRFFPPYYAVRFFGSGFHDPAITREQGFVFRGGRLERVSDFEQRLRRVYPGLKKVSAPPDADMLADHDRCACGCGCGCVRLCVALFECVYVLVLTCVRVCM